MTDDEKSLQGWNALVDRLEQEPASQRPNPFARIGSALIRKIGGIRRGDTIGEFYTVERMLDDRPVFVVHHNRVGRQFLLKLLPADIAQDAARRQRFRDEAYAMSSVAHDNIAYVTHFGDSEELGPFYVMERLADDTLAARLENGAEFDMSEVLDVAIDVGAALAALHDLGIVHRDVRPRNIISKENGDSEIWKLFEFGSSSRVVDAQDVLPLLTDGRYLAPEVARGERATPRADQFSLAATLYHLLFGRAPWPSRTVEDAGRDDAALEFPDSNVPEGVRQVLTRALQGSPSQRFDSVESLVSGMRRYSGKSRVASLPGVDVPEARRVAGDGDDSSTIRVDTGLRATPGPVGISNPEQTSPSIEVTLDTIASMKMRVHVAFWSARRIRREWRHNMIGGGIFVPTSRGLDDGSPVELLIEYGPTGSSGTFDGVVIGRGTPEAPGLAVAISGRQHEELEKFVASLDLGNLDPSARVGVTSIAPSEEFDPDEAFVRSRIVGEVTVGHMRSVFANLPIDVDDVLLRLEEKKLITIEGSPKVRPSRRQVDAGMTDEEFTRQMLDRLRYLKGEGNFQAAIQAAELATKRVERPELFFELGLLHVQFLGNLTAAREAFARAVELAPDEALYLKALDDIDKMMGR